MELLIILVSTGIMLFIGFHINVYLANRPDKTMQPSPAGTKGRTMELDYTYLQNGDFFVGFLNDYPNDSTQGRDVAELEESLAEVYAIRQEEKRHLAEIRRTGRLRMAGGSALLGASGMGSSAPPITPPPAGPALHP
jgi:hypothetical protein